VLFAIQVQARYQNKLLGLFLLEDRVIVAIPGCRQHLSPVFIQKLLQHFLPAKLTHDVFI